MRTTGIILVILGVLALIVTGFDLTTENELLDVGDIEVTEENERRIGWPPMVGGAMVVVGVILLIISKKRV